MIGLLMLAGCALVIGAFQSTPEQRRDARQRLARYNGPLYTVAALLWLALLWDLLPFA